MRAMIGPMTLVLLLAGCTTVRQDFRGSAPDAVWAALVAAAETPEYGDELPVSERWTVLENEVWADEASGRIEIHRRLVRVVHHPRSEPHRQDRTWKFRIDFKAGEKPPTAIFVSRGLAVPIQAVVEGERYFADVKTLLARPLP